MERKQGDFFRKAEETAPLRFFADEMINGSRWVMLIPPGNTFWNSSLKIVPLSGKIKQVPARNPDFCTSVFLNGGLGRKTCFFEKKERLFFISCQIAAFDYTRDSFEGLIPVFWGQLPQGKLPVKL